MKILFIIFAMQFTNDTTTKSSTDLHCLLEIPPSGLPLHFGRGNFMKEIPLSKTGKNRGKFVAFVDDEDYEWLNQYSWHIWKTARCQSMYAYAEVNGVHVRMHRLIMGVTDPNILVDHEDRNGLNCQRYNIRVATYSQNGANRKAWGKSKYLGVFWDKETNKWGAQLSKNRKLYKIGRFVDEISAAKAYDEAAKIHHGEYANLNFNSETV